MHNAVPGHLGLGVWGKVTEGRECVTPHQAILGWVWHEKAERGGDGERQADG